MAGEVLTLVGFSQKRAPDKDSSESGFVGCSGASGWGGRWGGLGTRSRDGKAAGGCALKLVATLGGRWGNGASHLRIIPSRAKGEGTVFIH